MTLEQTIKELIKAKECLYWTTGSDNSMRACNADCKQCGYYSDPKDRYSALVYAVDTLKRLQYSDFDDEPMGGFHS